MEYPTFVGFAHLKPSEMLNDEMDFSIPNKIKLTQWSVLEGTHFVGTEAKSGSQIELTAKEMDFQYNGDRFFLVIRSRTATDAMGKFRFSHVFPGKNSVAHDVNSRTIDASSSVRVSYSAAPGKTKRIRLGGNGTTVTGRLLRPDEAQDYAWKRIWIRMEEVQPNRAVAIPRVLGPNGLFNRAPLPVRVEKKTMRSFYAHPDTEGRFRIEDVPEGDWHFTARSGDLKIRANTISVTITPDDIAAGDAGEEKELGDIPTAVKE